MYGLPLIDIIVILIYFLGMIGIGLWSMRRIQNQEDYFLAGRRFGAFIQTFAAFGQGTSADTCVAVTSTTFRNGAGGIWSSLIYLPATPIYWLVVPWMRRLRLLTLGDFFEERYGSKRMAGVYAVIGTIGMMAILAVGFSAMTKTISALTPKAYNDLSVQEKAEYAQARELEHLRNTDYRTLSETQKARMDELILKNPRRQFSYINENVLISIVCAVVMIYAIAGGLEAAFLTDTIQGLFIILLSLILIPFSLAKINALYGGSGPMGAFRAVHQQLSESSFEIFGSAANVDFTWYYIATLTLMGAINVVIQPNMIVANGSAKDEYACRFGFVTGSFMKRLVTVFWGLFAILAIVLYHDKVQDPDLVWGYATRDLLGPLGWGLVGLMIACLMAALMSTADCLMITCSSLLTHNLYRPLVAGKSEHHYVSVGRIMGGLVVIGGALLATQFGSLLQMLKFMWEVNVMVAASFWLGMKWRRANKIAAWCSIISTAVLFFVLPLVLPNVVPSLRTNPHLLETTHPKPTARTYTARAMDVAARRAEIAQWEKLVTKGQTHQPRPAPLHLGQTFEKTFYPGKKFIFWTQGAVLGPDGRYRGQGLLNLELVALQKMGLDLARYPNALSETLRILVRTFIPFCILIVVALLTRPDDRRRLDLFFAKMKTEVSRDPETDAQEMALSYAHPDRFRHKNLFPNSSWELDKWDKTSVVGFLISVAVVFLIICFMKLLISLGG
jgi:solute:Na+ symporter, SSS family